MVVLQLTASFIEKAAIGLSLAILCLFLLAFALIAVVLFTISNSCWWRMGVDDRLVDSSRRTKVFPNESEPIDTVIGETPEYADLV
ncbi:hypothetical protein PRIPAC_72793 [Pristionchus pacificus]|uniref:Uncharacterized protein n=1 Tax=Pristionchus pacificus TaxID=54126 RepID=A0A2A6CSG4_PRIPA|nr:hypothetical protein PRIPAC_72793 [Pristionchus pacificus]|eukprot:PDM81007.1 hypothetical protein PRIPAC_36010 [Pristionchus pacificus]